MSEARIIDLEMKVTFQERRIEALDEALVLHARRVDELEETVALLKAALQRLRAEQRGHPVEGAMPEQDPVPHSG